MSHDFGPIAIKIDGGYTEITTDSSVDYNLGVEAPLASNVGLNTFNAVAGSGALGPGYLAARNALLPNGNTASVCQSLAEFSGTGVYGGNRICAPTSLDFDRSTSFDRQYVVEGILSSKFDGPFNFLVGGIYLNDTVHDNEYFVNAFGLDYASALLGGGTAYLATPFYQSDSKFYRLTSYGIFGEAYLGLTDNLKITLGVRNNNDKKHYEARTTLLNFPVAYGTTNAFLAPGFASFDGDPARPGNQALAINDVSFSRLTGRAVVDWQVTPRNLVYASYSRGYKSGGINPPLSPIFTVPTNFAPETVNAFEIGTKNSFLDRRVQLNLTGFYYQYKSLQLSRIVARTSVNDNVDADVYGAEAEAIIRPSRSVLVNLTASYLKTKISADLLLGNPQDPSGGRADAVIIKDVTNASNCAVGANNGSAALSNSFVAAVNGGIGLRAPVPIPGTNTTGAFSVCSALTATAAAQPAALVAAFGLPAGSAIPVTVFPSGVPVNIRGNELPQSPNYKFSAGVQYTAELGDYSLVPRVDLTYTAGYFGSIFNRRVNQIEGYAVINAQVQLNGPDNRFFVRGFVQNLQNNNAVTGLYVTDQSSGLFTNAFTLEPRRYGVSAGFSF